LLFGVEALNSMGQKQLTVQIGVEIYLFLQKEEEKRRTKSTPDEVAYLQ
jgi:hypothetical protein